MRESRKMTSCNLCQIKTRERPSRYHSWSEVLSKQNKMRFFAASHIGQAARLPSCIIPEQTSQTKDPPFDDMARFDIRQPQ
jgi:hypothetical protein